MKRTNFIRIAVLVAAVAFGAASTHALTQTEKQAVRQAVEKVRLPELAPKAARLVAEAPEKDRQEVAVTLVKAIVAKHPTIASALVGAIAKAAPEVSAAAAAAAAELAPRETRAIARAAASAAPSQAEKIAVEMAKVQPKAAVQIAVTVMNTVPAVASTVVASVGVAVPAVKPNLPRVSAQPALHGGQHGIFEQRAGFISDLDENPPDRGDTDAPNEVDAEIGSDPNRYGQP